MQGIKNAIRFYYDLQDLRIGAGNRDSKTDVALSKEDKEFLALTSTTLKKLEREAEKLVALRIKDVPINHEFLRKVRGVGTIMAGLMISEFDIEKAHTVSALWRFCGLAVAADGRAERRVKGQKSKFDPWLKAKMIQVLGSSFIKAVSFENGVYGQMVPKRDENNKIITVWNEKEKKDKRVMVFCPFPEGEKVYRRFYDDYKHRKQNQVVDKCMLCDGKGKLNVDDEKEPVKKGEKKKKKEVVCWNCEGTGGPAPWGCGGKHIDLCSKRYMVKMFLAELWNVWRALEGLEIRPPYAEEYLGRVHHGR